MTVIPFGADYDDDGYSIDAVHLFDKAHGDPDVPWPDAVSRVPQSPARPMQEFSLADYVRNGVPPPDLLCSGLLYAGGLHSIAGPPDCGKTTVALWWMLSHVRAGHEVMFLDEEGGAELVAEKLIALGATTEDVSHVRYFPFPSRNWGQCDVIVLRETLDQIKPTLVLWDSSAAFLSRAGLDENSASDVTKFWQQVLTPVAREHGAAVLVIDHDVKNGEPSRYARGSGAKLAATDVAYKLEAVKPFTRSQDGILKLFVSKDRRGWLHRYHRIHVEHGDTLSIHISESDESDDGGKPADLPPAQQKLLDATDETPASVAELVDRVVKEHGHGLKRETVSRALNELLKAGLVDRLDQGPGHAALWTRNA